MTTFPAEQEAVTAPDSVPFVPADAPACVAISYAVELAQPLNTPVLFIVRFDVDAVPEILMFVVVALVVVDFSPVKFCKVEEPVTNIFPNVPLNNSQDGLPRVEDAVKTEFATPKGRRVNEPPEFL
jgi:hypothetical protein